MIAGYAVPSGVSASIALEGGTLLMVCLFPQTVVAAGHTFIHLDPAVFPDPHTFNPDRWLERSKDLEQHLVAFSRGIRQCIGVK